MDEKVYTALGLMSGTSLDGVDVAIIETDGVDIFGFGDTHEQSYQEADKLVLQSVTEDALDWRFTGPLPDSFDQGEALVDRLHIEAVGGRNADIIGYHGQTILHHPPLDGKKGQTLQLGRGQVLADKLDAPVAYDFRTDDVAAGGQGAPLAPIYHEALVRYSKLEGRVVVVNIGGVSNMTFIEDGTLQWATDCGPGNGPLDNWIYGNNAGDYDKDGRLSFMGDVDHALIAKWHERDFFTRAIPRSADRYDFNVLADLHAHTLQDGAATLAAFCAQSIVRDVYAIEPDVVVVCGGGRKNAAVMMMLEMHIHSGEFWYAERYSHKKNNVSYKNSRIVAAETVGWDGDMLEAQAFAYLAVRTLKGLPISFPQTTGAPRPMTGGRVAYPSRSLGSRGGE